MATGTRSSAKAKAQIEKDMKKLTAGVDTVEDDVREDEGQVSPDDDVRRGEPRRDVVDAEVVVETKGELSDSDDTEQGKPDSVDAELIANMFERLLSRYDLVKKESVSTQRDDKLSTDEVTAAKSVKKKGKSVIEETSEEDVKPDTKATAKKKLNKVAQVTSADEKAEESEESDGKMKKKQRIAKVKAVSDSKQETKVKKKPKEKTKKEKSEAKKKFEDTESESEQEVVKPRKSTKKVQISSGENDTEPEEKAKPKKKKELKSKRKSEVCSTDAEAEDKKKKSVKVKVTKSKRKQETETETDSESEASETSDAEAKDYRKGRARQPKELPIDCFTGRAADTPVGTFLAHFKVVAKQNGWPKSQWACELVAKLRGEARALILPDEYSKVPSFEKVATKLRRHFGGDDDPETYESLLQGRTKGSDETVRELEEWMWVNGRRAYPDVKETAALDRMMKRNFVEALTNEDQRMHVRQSDAKNMTEAVKAAIKWEATHKSEQLRKQLRGGGGRVRIQVQETSLEREQTTDVSSRSKGKKGQQQKADAGSKVGLTEADLNRWAEERGVVTQRTLAAAGGATRSPDPLPPQPPQQQEQQREEQRPPGRTCFKCQQEGHLAFECPSLVCYNCMQKGHQARYCRFEPWCNHCQRGGHNYRSCQARLRQAAGEGQGNSEGASRSGTAAAPPPVRQ
jgi:hypothetical protein